MKKTLSFDPLTGTKEVFRYDPTDDSFTIETLQDVTDVVEFNKAMANQVDERANWKGDWHKVASIPMSVYMDLQKKGIANDDKAFHRWLNDSDNKVFRTRPGRL